jgi:hemerythrin
MTRIVWTKDLNTGIPELDNQHKRILELINRLHDLLDRQLARAHGHPGQMIQPLFPPEDGQSKEIALTIEDVLDYTFTHLIFEEALMDEQHYPYAGAHKKTHDAFRQRALGFQAFLQAGEDVAEELLHMLTNWLFNHIKDDDFTMAGYVLGKHIADAEFQVVA